MKAAPPRPRNSIPARPRDADRSPARFRPPRLLVLAVALVTLGLGARFYLLNSLQPPSLDQLAARSQSHPDSSSALHQFGAALLSQGDPDSAAIQLRKAAALAPSDGGIRRDLGIALLHTSQNTAARKELEEAVHLIPKDPDAWFYCGIARGRIGKENDAANALRQALKLNPNHAAALLDLGKLDAIAMGHYPTPPRWLTNEALSSLRRCVKLQPTDPETWYSLALAEGAAKQTKQSILDMSRSIQLKGDVGGAWIYRAEQREVAGEPDAEVESDAKRGLALDPNNSTGWAIVGRVEARAGKLNEAISSFTRAIQFSPTRLLSKDSLYRRAQAELQLGQKTAGNRDMNERARLDQLEAHIRALVVSPRPGDATYYQQLAQLYAAAGDHGLEARARRAAAELGKRQ